MNKQRNKLDNLVNGMIPRTTRCPYYDYCNLRNEKCLETRLNKLSCGAARAFTYLTDKELENEKLI